MMIHWSRPKEPLDAVGLLRSYDVRPVPDREEVAIAAARDAQSHADPGSGQPDIGLGRIETQGQGMLAKLNHDLDQQLHVVDEEIVGREKAVETQAKVVEREQRRVDGLVEAKQRIVATLEAWAEAKGRPLHKLGLRKLSTTTYILLLAVFGVADAVFNAAALLVIGDGNLAVWGLAIALVVALLWVSHVAGTELREAEEHRDDPRGRRKPWWALLAVGAIVAFLTAIGTIRAEFLEKQHDVGGHLLAVYLLQLLVAVAAVAAAYYHADPDAAALQQAEEQVKRAEANLQDEEAVLSERWVDLKAMQIERVYLVLGYLQVGEAALKLIDELKFLYATVYFRTLRAAGRPTVELAISPTPRPPWMPAREIWLDKQTDVDQASVGTAWRELSPPAA
jgi:hypothetical protein